MSLRYLNLVGDDDADSALRYLEREFDVAIALPDGADLRTAGDLFRVVRSALPLDVAQQPSTWRRFCWALAQETGDPPGGIGPDTLLLVPPDVNLWTQLRSLVARLRLMPK